MHRDLGKQAQIFYDAVNVSETPLMLPDGHPIISNDGYILIIHAPNPALVEETQLCGTPATEF